jgi:hypothetical protein
MFQRVKEARS